MTNIKLYNIERTIKNELKILFPKYTLTRDFKFVKEDKDMIVDISYYCQRVAGQEVLHSFVHFYHKSIEEKWRVYIDELMIQKNVMYPTISVDVYNLGLADNITKTTSVIGHMNNVELKEFIKHLFGTIYKEKIEYYRSIENCEKTLNKSIEITDEVMKISDIEALPFRKVLLAEAVGNPDLPKIKDAMRTYCNEQYEVGKKENFEKLMRLKPVFEKMFG